MVIDITLGIIFFGSIAVLWRQVSVKFPELAAITDEVIAERLHNDSSKVRVFLYHAVTLYRDRRFRVMVRDFIGKIFYRIHILLLRIDNGVVSLIKKIRANGSFENGNGNGAKYAWDALKKTDDIRPKE